ncbi:MAG: hypothetical protein JWQ72_848 [Polaromonas sp.]|nr:hypothetical protein [Polaromonas sp.]
MNKRTPSHRARRWPLLGLCALMFAGAARAGEEPASGAGVWLAESDHALDQLRGGFDLGSGLLVSFGITRAVFANGQLMSTTTLQLGDISKLTASQLAALGNPLNTQALVLQNGPGNTITSGALGIPLATYIQNTLSNQTLGAQTVINASTNGLSLVKNLNLQGSLNDALSRAIGSR